VRSRSPQASSTGSSEPRLLTVKQAAEYLATSAWAIRTLGWSGTIPPVRIGKRVLFDRRDLDKFVESAKAVSR
jgi:excisionase family DNA binding protein